MSARIPTASLAGLTDDQRLIVRLFGMMDHHHQGEVLHHVARISTALSRAELAQPRTMNESFYWTKAVPGNTPDSERNVLVWDSADGIPVTAYFEEDDQGWYGIAGGLDLTEVVTHWREIEAPVGAKA